jgi:hypothetical protein
VDVTSNTFFKCTATFRTHCMWRTGYSNELNMPYDELDIVKMIKIRIIRWFEHLLRI